MQIFMYSTFVERQSYPLSSRELTLDCSNFDKSKVVKCAV